MSTSELTPISLLAAVFNAPLAEPGSGTEPMLSARTTSSVRIRASFSWPPGMSGRTSSLASTWALLSIGDICTPV